ncbi:MAG: hypothetical protein ACFFDY_00195 [Candidatus Thorarchaeota archaeon]
MPMGPTILDLNNTFTICKKCGYKMFHVFLIGKPENKITMNKDGFLEEWEGSCPKCVYPWIADCGQNKKTIQIVDGDKAEKEKLTIENPFIVQFKEINSNLKSINKSLSSIENRIKDLFHVYTKKG